MLQLVMNLTIELTKPLWNLLEQFYEKFQKFYPSFPGVGVLKQMYFFSLLKACFQTKTVARKCPGEGEQTHV